MRCKGCGRKPSEILEYQVEAEMEGISPDRFVRESEGTYNEDTGEFYCTSCYLKIGTPSGKA